MGKKPYEVVGWTWNGAVYCPSCAKDHPQFEKMQNENKDGGPVFADSESDYPQYCDSCGSTIQNNTLN